jgi:hypothetical protein
VEEVTNMDLEARGDDRGGLGTELKEQNQVHTRTSCYHLPPVSP